MFIKISFVRYVFRYCFHCSLLRHLIYVSIFIFSFLYLKVFINKKPHRLHLRLYGQILLKSAVPPYLKTYHYAYHFITAITVLYLTLPRPRLLITFRHSPQDPILSNTVSVQLPPSWTLYKSYVSFLSLNGLVYSKPKYTVCQCFLKIFLLKSKAANEITKSGNSVKKCKPNISFTFKKWQ